MSDRSVVAQLQKSFSLYNYILCIIVSPAGVSPAGAVASMFPALSREPSSPHTDFNTVY